MQNTGEDKARKCLMNEGTLKSKDTLFFHCRNHVYLSSKAMELSQSICDYR